MQVFVLDLDGSVERQSCFLERLRRTPKSVEVVNVREFAEKMRILATRRTMRTFASRLPRRASTEMLEVFFYGSGDFHHVAAVLQARVHEPISIIQLDNHPDWVLFPPTYNCGSWVNRALDSHNVRRIVTIGPAAGDLVWPEFKSANLKAIENGQLEVYPWRAEPSRVLRRYGPSPCWMSRPGSLAWSTITAETWELRLHDIIDRLPTDAVWITLDKDVLGPADAVTNWEQAGVPLHLIVKTFEMLAARKRVVGVDVCGDYSPRIFGDPFRRLLAHLDSPETRPPTGEDLAINDVTNRILLESFDRIFGHGAKHA